jgi:proteasome lid subunit RPN8/RPN11
VRLVLPERLQGEIASAAKAAFPAECCGLIEGIMDANGFEATRVHAARNLAKRQDRFEIDPRDHIEVAKAARSRGASIIGCYHSHPNGRAEPSGQDRAEAQEEDFLWLIAATDGARCEMRTFLCGPAGFTELSAPNG